MSAEELFKWQLVENVSFWRQKWSDQYSYVQEIEAGKGFMSTKRYNEILKSAQEQFMYTREKEMQWVWLVKPYLKRKLSGLKLLEFVLKAYHAGFIEFEYHPFQDECKAHFFIRETTAVPKQKIR